MKEKIKLTEKELYDVLKTFNNKNADICFNGEMTGRIKFYNIKAEIKDFEIKIYSIKTHDILCVRLYDVSNIEKTKDEKRIYLQSETLGEIVITR